MKMCGDPQDAEDVLQETMITLARSIGDFRGEAALSTWLYTVARSFCLKKRRNRRHAPKEIASFEDERRGVAAVPGAGPGPEEVLSSKETEVALEQAIAGLEPEQREVLVLRDVEGLTASQVAEVLGVTVAAVKSRLHRARLAVRAKIKPLLGIEESTDTASGETCPDVLMLYSQHLEDEISSDLCAQMEAHVAHCPRCRGVCDSLKRSLTLCQQKGTEKVPRKVQESVRAALRVFLAEPAT
jgi:RNA polymerase sigma-70 factor (ECF subfamily)